MLVSSVRALLQRELAALRRSIEAYPDDASVWAERPGLPNTAGTLALHLAGNLQHFCGAVLGGSGYRRDRDAEFSRRGVPRSEIVAELTATGAAIDRALEHMADDPNALAAPYPEKIANRTVAVGDFLVHLEAHLAYHLGQIDYHRRVVTGNSQGIGAMAPGELPVRPSAT